MNVGVGVSWGWGVLKCYLRVRIVLAFLGAG
jgi:hypothetical protein